MVETNFYFPMLSVSGNSGTGTGCSRGTRAIRNCQQSQGLSTYINSMPFLTIGSCFPLPEAPYGFQNQLDPCNTVEWKVHTFKCNPILGGKLQHMTEQTWWLSRQDLPISSINDYFEAWFSVGSAFSAFKLQLFPMFFCFHTNYHSCPPCLSSLLLNSVS